MPAFTTAKIGLRCVLLIRKIIGFPAWRMKNIAGGKRQNVSRQATLRLYGATNLK
jgi:1-aminocyclopropane-1-carboxylate deaminase/D-cysteine desulfhydrase-like pyridoxal-dependent ACC family enzyme